MTWSVAAERDARREPRPFSPPSRGALFLGVLGFIGFEDRVE
jgi:hypothetical protein